MLLTQPLPLTTRAEACDVWWRHPIIVSSAPFVPFSSSSASPSLPKAHFRSSFDSRNSVTGRQRLAQGYEAHIGVGPRLFFPLSRVQSPPRWQFAPHTLPGPITRLQSPGMKVALSTSVEPVSTVNRLFYNSKVALSVVTGLESEGSPDCVLWQIDLNKPLFRNMVVCLAIRRGYTNQFAVS